MNIRIIPRLDIKGERLVKGIQLEGLRVLGRPEQFARYYSETGADELLYMDVVASLYGRNSLLEMVHQTSKEIFIPLTVGGGIRTLDDIRSVLRAGADKVAINTGAISRHEFIRESAQQFGSSTVVVSIEAIRRPDGTYEAYTDNGRERTGIDAFEWAQRAVELGAGELMITAIDREGTRKGFDLELTRRIATAVPIPVIACGGAGSAEDVAAVVASGKADAVAIASLLHYRFLRDSGGSQAPRGPEYAEVSRVLERFQGCTLAEIKRHLADQGIECRPATREEAHA